MKRNTHVTLYYLLPAIFWLLAVGGSALFYHDWPGYIVTALVLFCILILGRIKPYTMVVEQSFQIALLMGIASYWMPSALFLIVPAVGFLIFRRLFNLRTFLALLIGFAAVAIWLVLLSRLSILDYSFSLTKNALGWIPIGAFIAAWLASTIVRQNLRVR